MKMRLFLLAFVAATNVFSSTIEDQVILKENACEQISKDESVINFCYGVSQFEELRVEEITHCGATFSKPKVLKRCIDEAATSTLTLEEITECKKQTKLSISAINCLYAAANSVQLTVADIKECGARKTPNGFSSCLVDKAGDL